MSPLLSRRSRPVARSLRPRLECLEERLNPGVDVIASEPTSNSSRQTGPQVEVGAAVNPLNPLNVVTVANDISDLSRLGHLAELIRQRGGVVLSASSVVGLYGNFGQTNYVATKAGVIGMTRTWARELGRHRIRVNAVAPGFIATDILRTMPQGVLDALVARTPIGRIGTPEDVAEAYAWLASDRASFVHGAVLSVDGGLVGGT